MTDSKYYSGTNHIFYSDNGTNINISAGSGQSLSIEGYTPGTFPEAGQGLNLVSNEFNVLTDDATIEIDAFNKLSLKNGGITSNKLANSAVTNEKLANSSLTITTGTGLSGGGSVSLGYSTTLSLTNNSITLTAGDGLSGGATVSLGGSTSFAVNSSVVRTTGNQSITGDKTFEKVILDGGINDVSIIANTGTTAPYTLTLPVDDGASNQILSTNGSGALSWVNPVSGSNKYIQYNDNGVLGSEAAFTYDKDFNSMTVSGITTNVVSGASTLTFNTAGTTKYSIGSTTTNAICNNFGTSTNTVYNTGENVRVQSTYNNTNGFVGINNHYSPTSGVGTFQAFTYNTTGVGSIYSSGSSTIYGTTSDYRLKKDIINIDENIAITRIKGLNPVNFKWISTDTCENGFIAHEFGTVYPCTLNCKKDAVNENGDPIYQNISKEACIPDLVAVIKNLLIRIEELEEIVLNK